MLQIFSKESRILQENVFQNKQHCQYPHQRGNLFCLTSYRIQYNERNNAERNTFEIEYMKGIAKMQMNAGIASSISLQLIFATDCIMKKPTTISAGAVAKEGIARNTGEKNSARMNSKPETIEVRPVLPPSAIPEEDSTKSSDGRGIPGMHQRLYLQRQPSKHP